MHSGEKDLYIPKFSADADATEVHDALAEAGCVVVTGLTSSSKRREIVAELDPFMQAARVIDDDDPSEFYPGRTRRVTALLARSETITDEMVAHDLTQGICERFLLPNGEFGYQLHVTAALEVGPGAREQVLHREEDSFTYFELPRPNLIVASMWAITDFRADNGATLLVPGSHRWEEGREAEPGEIVQAEMPAGSVLFWLGGLLHGAGANTAGDWRYGVILTYSAGWVRQEETQYLNVPQDRLLALSPEIRRIAGFDMYRGLGLYDPSVS